jgi:predicted nucleic acid-binding protein
MARATDRAAHKNGHEAKPVVSKLGRELRRIREKIEASGEKMLTRRELEREVADRRAGNFWAPEVAAQTEAAKAGLGAMDALHLAAAHLARADEFITTEKPNKAIHRSSLVKVVYLFI